MIERRTQHVTDAEDDSPPYTPVPHDKEKKNGACPISYATKPGSINELLLRNQKKFDFLSVVIVELHQCPQMMENGITYAHLGKTLQVHGILQRW
ncbi:hypothetical protein OS493_018991 [Desmophyllum pertusum]|uniref:Uncharacterized protein n=1 Tax=Desmophyllum pertusum TaxID=174260 RepID=A0A9W9Z194_9CNID|nr:hypothetical protein OS493_018991 [Desmophyllum pertusum]